MKIQIFRNGFKLRKPNRKITLIENNNDEDGNHVIIEFVFADKNPNKPAVIHQSIKGKLRVSVIKISTESLEDLMEAYVDYKNNTL